MAHYRPDYTYIEAKKIVAELGNSKKDQLIKYYIEYHQNWHDKDKEKLKEFYNFFKTLNRFLPKSNGIIG